VRAYARRAPHIDRMILACFVLGLSTRKVATALLPILGRRVSAAWPKGSPKSVRADRGMRRVTLSASGVFASVGEHTVQNDTA